MMPCSNDFARTPGGDVHGVSAARRKNYPSIKRRTEIAINIVPADIDTGPVTFTPLSAVAAKWTSVVPLAVILEDNTGDCAETAATVA
jgi:hypothetical protein